MTNEDRNDYLARGIDDLRTAQDHQREDLRAVGEDVADLAARFNDVLLQVGIQTAAQLELADQIKAMNIARLELAESWSVRATEWDATTQTVKRIEGNVARARANFPKVATGVLLLLGGGGALELLQHFLGF